MLRGAVRTLVAAAVLVVLVVVALRTGAGRSPVPGPAGAAAALRVEVSTALVPERPEECQLDVRTHHHGRTTTGGGVAATGRHQEHRETVDGRFEVVVAGRPCTADPMAVTVRDPGALVVEVAVANSAPRLLPGRIGAAGRGEGGERDAR